MGSPIGCPNDQLSTSLRAERFYRQVAAPALIGMEATGNCHWLVDLLSELGHELWVGDAAQIRASYVRQPRRPAKLMHHL